MNDNDSMDDNTPQPSPASQPAHAPGSNGTLAKTKGHLMPAPAEELLASRNGAPAPSDMAAPAAHTRYWLRAFRVPLIVAVLCGLGAWLTCTFVVTQWYSSSATLYFASPGGSGAAGLLNSLTGSGAALSDGTVPFLGGLYNVPQVGNGPGTAMMAMSTVRCTSRVMSECHLAQRWNLTPEQAAKRLLKNVSYGVDKNGLLAVQFADPDPRTSRDVVNSYVNAMRDITRELNVFIARRTRQALESDLNQRQQTLTSEQNSLAALQAKAAHGALIGAASPSDYVRLDVERQQTATQLKQTEAQINRVLAAARLAAGMGTSLPADMSFAQAQGAQLRDLQTRLFKAQDTLGPDNPDLLSLKAQVAEAQQKYKREINNRLSVVQTGIAPGVDGMFVERAGLQARLSSINALMAPLRAHLSSSLPKVPAHELRIARLQNQIRTDQLAVNAMEIETDRARLTESRTVPTFEVVDAAAVPVHPALPHTTLTTVFAAVAGFLLAFAWRVARAVSRHPSVASELRRLAELYDFAPAPALAYTVPVANGLSQNGAPRPASAHSALSQHLKSPEAPDPASGGADATAPDEYSGA